MAARLTVNQKVRVRPPARQPIIRLSSANKQPFIGERKVQPVHGSVAQLAEAVVLETTC